jgi:hypothetical protein
MPIVDPTAAGLMESATAPDPLTFEVTWNQPYYLADALGLQLFWPLPSHLLEAEYNALVVQQKDALAFMARPFWTAEYVHVGPFRLVEFNAGHIQNEPLQLGVRSVVEMAVYQIMTDYLGLPVSTGCSIEGAPLSAAQTTNLKGEKS